MRFLDWVFGRSKPDKISALDDTHLLKEIEQSLRQHLAHAKTASATHNGFHIMENKLLRPDILTFAVTAVDQEMKKSLSEDLHHYQGRGFGDIYVAVSAIPVENPSQARTYFGCGYFRFLEVLLNECDYGSGEIDLAHWVCCQGAFHLTFLPGMKLAKTQRSTILFAQDLMTVEEKSEARNAFGR